MQKRNTNKYKPLKVSRKMFVNSYTSLQICFDEANSLTLLNKSKYFILIMLFCPETNFLSHLKTIIQETFQLCKILINLAKIGYYYKIFFYSVTKIKYRLTVINNLFHRIKPVYKLNKPVLSINEIFMQFISIQIF